MKTTYPKLTIQKATLEDLKVAAANLSEGDLRDFNCMQAGRQPMDVFPKHLDATTVVIKFLGEVLAVGGHSANVWLITTKVVTYMTQAERYGFYRLIKSHVDFVRSQVQDESILSNFVSLANLSHIKLLKKLGSKISEETYSSPAGFHFKKFYLGGVNHV